MTEKLREYQEALMDMVNQHCRADHDLYCDLIWDAALSANEDAIALLERDGLAILQPGTLWRWKLNWDAVILDKEDE